MSLSYFPTIPAATNDPADDQPSMQTNFASINTLIGIDHVTFGNNANGQHNQVTFATSNVPTPPVTPPISILFSQVVNSLPALFFYAGDAAHTTNQYISAASGSTYLLGGMILKWGPTGVVADNAFVTFASAFPNNCYGVLLTIIDPNATSRTINVTTGTVSKTGFNVRTSGLISAFYIAIGN